MKVLVACEESQVVCKAFRERGHEAYSCDIIPCSGGHPEWHIMQDVIPLLDGRCFFKTMDDTEHFIPDRWDLVIAHPPFTYLTVTGNRWFNIEKYGEKAIYRQEKREKAIDFFMEFASANCKRICIENPVGVISTEWRKPDQIINPYMFGDAAEKRSCLWLLGLPKLKPTNMVTPPERLKFDSGKTMPAWYAEAWKLPKEERAKIRSKTFQELPVQWQNNGLEYANRRRMTDA